jgi:hypothetical protein
MAVSRERFATGLTYEQYKQQMTRNKERFEQNERNVQISEADLAAFRLPRRPVNVLVLAEDWCGDVIANLPVLGRLAAESGKLNLRVFLRDQNPDIMDQYLNRGQFKSIPVFVFFDESFGEVGRLVERPSSVTELTTKKRAEIYAKHPEFGEPGTPVDQLPEDVRAAFSQAMAAMREEIAPFSNREVIKELSAIVARVPA